MRSMVEGGCRERQNSVGDPIDIPQNVLGRNADDPIVQATQEKLARLVALGAVTHKMYLAVNFDNQPRCCAEEIDDVGIDRVLLSEADAVRRAFKALPQEHLGQRHVAPEAAGFVHGTSAHRWRTPSTKFHLVPLPVPGRI